jgi:4-hydroxybutyrate CoA-transferase
MTLLSPAEALSHVRSGMTVAFPHLSAEPGALTQALWARAAEVSNLTVYSGMLLSGYDFLKTEAAKNLRFKTWFMPGTLLRKTAGDVRAEYLPLTWAQTARFLCEMPIHVALIQVGPADAKGNHSLGVNSTVAMALVRHAKLVIAQVNDQLPRTFGASSVHASELDFLVHENRPLIAFPHRPTDEIDGNIGRRIAAMVPDGAVLQFGIGGIPGAVVDALVDRGARDLQVISMLTDSARHLIEAGCCRSENPKALVGDILGTTELYRWVDGNPAVALADALDTHSVESFVRRPNLFSVNSGLEIDLFGQVNSETLGGKQAGAIGGSVDFAVAGQVDGVTAVVGLRSTTNKGQTRIVRRLDSEIVTISRTFVQTVVTEHGVADLRNKSVVERAIALAKIAHPDHREALLAQAAELN